MDNDGLVSTAWRPSTYGGVVDVLHACTVPTSPSLKERKRWFLRNRVRLEKPADTGDGVLKMAESSRTAAQSTARFQTSRARGLDFRVELCPVLMTIRTSPAMRRMVRGRA